MYTFSFFSKTKYNFFSKYRYIYYIENNSVIFFTEYQIGFFNLIRAYQIRKWERKTRKYFISFFTILTFYFFLYNNKSRGNLVTFTLKGLAYKKYLEYI